MPLDLRLPTATCVLAAAHPAARLSAHPLVMAGS
jgi:hypothetical protein